MSDADERCSTIELLDWMAARDWASPRLVAAGLRVGLGPSEMDAVSEALRGRAGKELQRLAEIRHALESTSGAARAPAVAVTDIPVLGAVGAAVFATDRDNATEWAAVSALIDEHMGSDDAWRRRSYEAGLDQGGRSVIETAHGAGHSPHSLRRLVETAASTFAVLAVRGAGKLNTAAVLAEEMFDADVPWVAVDPKGDYWGLRSSADGNGAGLPIPIFGGLHGDVPLDERSGAVVAELIVAQNLTCVLDVSDFASKAAQARFLTDFAERIFHLHGRNPTVRHIILEEADEIVPQRVMANMARCVGAWTKLVKQGRQRGLGVTLVSQRSAVVNKDALTQIETLIPLRTTSPQDRTAILGWVDYHAVGRELVDSLPALPDGEGWVISPHLLGRIERVSFRRRRTFDSGAAPKVGQSDRPATLADIDVLAIRSEMAEVVAKAEENDPKALRARVHRLEAELKAAASKAAPERVGGQVPDPATAAELESVRSQLATLRSSLNGSLDMSRRIVSALEQVAAVDGPGPEASVPGVAAGNRNLLDGVNLSDVEVAGDAVELGRRSVAASQESWRAKPSEAPPSGGQALAAQQQQQRVTGVEASLPKAQRAILTVLAQHPDGRSKRQLAMQAGYSAGGGGFNNALSALRSSGLINRGDPLSATTAGIEALGEKWEPLPSGRALFEHWVSQSGKAGRLILEALGAAWPEGLTKVELAELTGYAAGGGGFNNALSALRTLQLIDDRDPITLDRTLGESLETR